ncbi:MAG: NAD(+)/NADH kinase [Lachnospiraceae bacterium]|nr:NAD(+)/NADH kinase [Lachnospiraceae bacterium]
MNRFFIITNESRDPDLKLTREIEQHIRSCGKICVGQFCSLPQDDEEAAAGLRASIPDETDCIIVLGGDGTLLRAARNLFMKNIPFLGINTGHLGYLTEGSGNTAEKLLDKVFADEFVIEDRMLIGGEITDRSGEASTGRIYALNDITLNRNNSLKIIEFNLYVNDELLYNYSADGIIISTPTGSTAYNLSCGGPVAIPTSRLIIVTPIAPHSLNNRSLVLSADDRIEVEIVGSGKDPDGLIGYVVYFDGDADYRPAPGCRLRVEAVDRVVRLVRLSRQSFLQTLKAKMS